MNDVITFGCRLNSYESEVIRTQLAEAGQEDVIVFNTCAVTKEAERQARQAIRRQKRLHPDKEIIVTGCAAQIDPERFAAMPEVSRVIGNDRKTDADAYRLSAAPDSRVLVNDIFSVRDTASHLVTDFSDKSRAFVQIQNGCNHRCTFCIIPYGRGNSRSAPVGEIVEQVRALVENGYREVVMTGVDIGAYGEDLPGRPTLGEMVRRVLTLVPELPRLRLSSIDAIEADPALMLLIAEEPRLMPHLHLSIQAGDDMILKRMKRRHTRRDIIDFCAETRRLRPDMVFGADLIAGFPTETDEMFRRTLELIEEAGLTWLHVFPYSERPGTPAARMPAVAPAVRRERAALLREKGEEQIHRLLSGQTGRTLPFLVEANGIGRSPHYIPARLEGPDLPPPGHIIEARVTGVEGERLVAQLKTDPVAPTLPAPAAPNRTTPPDHACGPAPHAHARPHSPDQSGDAHKSHAEAG